MGFVQRHQIRDFFKTGRTPSRPEIYQYPFSTVIAKPVRFPLRVGQGKIPSMRRARERQTGGQKKLFC